MKKALTAYAITGLMALLVCLPAHALRINVLGKQYFTTAQTQKLDQAITVLNQVLNSPEFREGILNFTYQGQNQFVQNNGLTNQQILDQLMAGAERYPSATQANELADMYLSIYYPPWYKRFTSAVAFTSQSDKYLHLYNSYYNNSSLEDLSATLVHEWTHKMGFDHDFNSTARRPYSVPYGVGGVVTRVVRQYLNQ